MHALLVTYGLDGTTRCEYAELSEALSPAFAAVPGPVSQTPLENATSGRYGAFHVLETGAQVVAAERQALGHPPVGASPVATLANHGSHTRYTTTHRGET